MQLTPDESRVLSGQKGSEGARMALRIVIQSARMLGASRLVPVASAHIDGCLYHGRSGTLFCERLVEAGARVAVPATTNVGALNLLNPEQSRLTGEARNLAFRLMVAHERMGCRPSWTCAPYQAGARPTLGSDVAWGESNAVGFVNSILGARTNRYGDFLDIACAIAGRAPFSGLHLSENRKAALIIDVSGVSDQLQSQSVFYPVLGALIGRLAGSAVPAVVGLSGQPDEDHLKALCAGAAATGAVGLVHLVGITPEAPDLHSVSGRTSALPTIHVDAGMLEDARDRLSAVPVGAQIDCVALGSPHMSVAECRAVLHLAQGRKFKVPMYLCLGRHTLDALTAGQDDLALQALGAVLVVDTCVVVTPILPRSGGVMMTNSAKFAHYAKGNTGYDPVFGSTASCVLSAQNGCVTHAPEASV